MTSLFVNSTIIVAPFIEYTVTGKKRPP